MKPLSKYHHKNELAGTVDVNKVKKTNKEELQYEITGTSKESTQRQRKPLKKVKTPVKNDEDEASSDSDSSDENCVFGQEIFSHSK
jgi:SAM-dependent MidA family methyltransferase